jgi:hypothetical protein
MKMRIYLTILVSCLIFTTNFVYTEDDQNDTIFDGPHIFYNNDSLFIKYYDGDVSKIYKIKMDSVTNFKGFLHDSTESYIIPLQFKSPSDKYSDAEQLFVVSDIHGQYNIFQDLLKSNGIIDRDNSWIWEDGHLIILGDVFDRGAQVQETLWLIYNLEQQAKKAGGAIHLLLGNHEVMVLQNDLRYVHDKYFKIAESFSISVPELYGENTFWGRWLRSKNILTKIGPLLFVHGGIHPNLITKYNSITNINTLMKKNLDTNRDDIKNDPTLSQLFRKDGPIWYRGFFSPDSMPDVSDDELTDILNHFNVEKIIVGHTTEDTIYSSHNNRVLCVDGGIKYGLRGEGLLIIGDMYYRVDTNGTRELIVK